MFNRLLFAKFQGKLLLEMCLLLLLIATCYEGADAHVKDKSVTRHLLAVESQPLKSSKSSEEMTSETTSETSTETEETSTQESSTETEESSTETNESSSETSTEPTDTDESSSTPSQASTTAPGQVFTMPPQPVKTLATDAKSQTTKAQKVADSTPLGPELPTSSQKSSTTAEPATGESTSGGSETEESSTEESSTEESSTETGESSTEESSTETSTETEPASSETPSGTQTTRLFTMPKSGQATTAEIKSKTETSATVKEAGPQTTTAAFEHPRTTTSQNSAEGSTTETEESSSEETSESSEESSTEEPTTTATSLLSTTTTKAGSGTASTAGTTSPHSTTTEAESSTPRETTETSEETSTETDETSTETATGTPTETEEELHSSSGRSLRSLKAVEAPQNLPAVNVDEEKSTDETSKETTSESSTETEETSTQESSTETEESSTETNESSSETSTEPTDTDESSSTPSQASTTAPGQVFTMPPQPVKTLATDAKSQTTKAQKVADSTPLGPELPTSSQKSSTTAEPATGESTSGGSETEESSTEESSTEESSTETGESSTEESSTETSTETEPASSETPSGTQTTRLFTMPKSGQATTAEIKSKTETSATVKEAGPQTTTAAFEHPRTTTSQNSAEGSTTETEESSSEETSESSEESSTEEPTTTATSLLSTTTTKAGSGTASTAGTTSPHSTTEAESSTPRETSETSEETSTQTDETSTETATETPTETEEELHSSSGRSLKTVDSSEVLNRNSTGPLRIVSKSLKNAGRSTSKTNPDISCSVSLVVNIPVSAAQFYHATTYSSFLQSVSNCVQCGSCSQEKFDSLGCEKCLIFIPAVVERENMEVGDSIDVDIEIQKLRCSIAAELSKKLDSTLLLRLDVSKFSNADFVVRPYVSISQRPSPAPDSNVILSRTKSFRVSKSKEAVSTFDAEFSGAGRFVSMKPTSKSSVYNESSSLPSTISPKPLDPVLDGSYEKTKLNSDTILADMSELTNTIADGSAGGGINAAVLLVSQISKNIFSFMSSFTSHAEGKRSLTDSHIDLESNVKETHSTRIYNPTHNAAPFVSSPDDDQEVIPGLESLGRVKRLLGPVYLSTPACDQDTSYSLYSGRVHLFFESGSWPCAQRPNMDLSVYVFIPPQEKTVPGDVCGPAVYIQSHNYQPLRPVYISLPCDAAKMNGSNEALPLSFDLVSGNWVFDGTAPEKSVVNGTLWTQTRKLSVHAASFFSEKSFVAGSKMGVIVGSVIGSAFVVVLTSLVVWFRYRIQFKQTELLETQDNILPAAENQKKRQSSVFSSEAVEFIYNMTSELRRQSALRQRRHSTSAATVEQEDGCGEAEDSLIADSGVQVDFHIAKEKRVRQSSGSIPLLGESVRNDVNIDDRTGPFAQ